MTLVWIVASGALMSSIALVGGVTTLLGEATLKRAVPLLVAFAAGSLLGGAFLHMLPEAQAHGLSAVAVSGWALVGFTVFFAVEQFLHWHHCHRAASDCPHPMTYLVLLGDGIHNLMGGIAVGAAFVVDIGLGITTWVVAAAHEVPQELGDFGVLVHGGWDRRRALILNLVSASTFLVGGLFAYLLSFGADVGVLLPLAAGNFIYIAASDLVPEVNKHHDVRVNVTRFAAFALGILLLLGVRLVVQG
jgi:zinc and cadmium transporter